MLDNSFSIGDRPLGGDASPYVIAEIGSNHNQSLDTARQLIDAAAEAGADAAKFQLFSAAELYPETSELFPIFKANELSPDWLEPLDAHCRSRNIAFMASAFDRRSVKLLDALNVPAFKVASSETTNLPLLLDMAQTGRPLLISTGMCTMADVADAVAVCEASENCSVALLQCAAVYPAPIEQINLRAMMLMGKTFGCPTGFSDHTMGTAAAIASVGAGAAVYERHITLDRDAEGPDHFYAMESEEFSGLVGLIREAHSALGRAAKEPLPQEQEFGRREGVYLAADLKAGHVLRAEDFRLSRPAIGVPARLSSAVVGQRLAQDAAEGDALMWAMLDGSQTP